MRKQKNIYLERAWINLLVRHMESCYDFWKFSLQNYWIFLQYEQVFLILQNLHSVLVLYCITSLHCTKTEHCVQLVVQFIHVMYLYCKMYTLYGCNVCTHVLCSTQLTFRENTHICFCEVISLSFSDLTFSEMTLLFY